MTEAGRKTHYDLQHSRTQNDIEKERIMKIRMENDRMENELQNNNSQNAQNAHNSQNENSPPAFIRSATEKEIQREIEERPDEIVIKTCTIGGHLMGGAKAVI
jgi:hypothetical protein